MLSTCPSVGGSQSYSKAIRRFSTSRVTVFKFVSYILWSLNQAIFDASTILRLYIQGHLASLKSAQSIEKVSQLLCFFHLAVLSSCYWSLKAVLRNPL